jgi:hypothetical protein
MSSVLEALQKLAMGAGAAGGVGHDSRRLAQLPTARMERPVGQARASPGGVPASPGGVPWGGPGQARASSGGKHTHTHEEPRGGLPPPAGSLPPLRWLHVPKSGSALINVLARYACAELRGTSTTFDVALNFSAWLRGQGRGASSSSEIALSSTASVAATPSSSSAAAARAAANAAAIAAARRRCPSLMPPWQAHSPAQPHELNRSVLAGVFRRPAQRLLSGFHHVEGGLPDAMIAPGMAAEQRAAMRRHARGNPARYARWPGVSGCATKMLLGRPCASSAKPVRSEDAERAAGIVRRRFRFVGLLEHWNTTVCVFHALLMGGSPPDPAELLVTHANQRKRHAAGSEGYDEAALQGFVDEHDEKVYAAATARFWADARRARCA